MELSRKKIWLYWILTGVLASAITSVMSIVYWHLTYVPEANVNWAPINDMIGMLVIMPLGLLVSILTPAGWLGILGLYLALSKRNLKPLVFTVAGAILFGLFWPTKFVSMMGI